MKLFKSFFLCVSIAFFISCSNNLENENDLSQGVKIRFKNVGSKIINNIRFTASFIDNAIVIFNTKNYGDLRSNQQTVYKSFEKLEGSGSFKVTVDGQDYEWALVTIPEMELSTIESGYLTYEIYFNASTERLSCNRVFSN